MGQATATVKFETSFSPNVPHKTADTITIGELLTTALNWIEDQIQSGRNESTLALQQLLKECEQTAVAAYHQLARQQTVEISGLGGAYPLAVGLSLISTASGKPWGFAAQPQAWSDDDWHKVTGAIQFLHDQPILYRTGREQLSIVSQPMT